MKYIRATILTAMLFLLCTACLVPEDSAKERAERAREARGDIVVGAVASWSAIDVMLWEGIAVAADEINAAGGILGRKLRILKRDNEGSVEKGLLIAQEFGENQDLVAVVGHYQSFITVPASVVYQYYGILLLSTVDTNPDLTRQGFSLIFRSVPDDMEYGKQLADFCRQKGLDRLMVLLERNEYGRDFSDAFATMAQSQALQILDGASYDQMTKEETIEKVLQQWIEHYSFDAVLLSGELPRAAAIIGEARRIGIHQPILGGVAMDQNRLLKLAGKEADNIFLPTDFNPHAESPEIQRFVKAFGKRYDCAPDVMAAQGYDTVYALAYAIETAGSASPPDMARALRSMDDRIGVTGSLRFSDSGARVVDRIYIKRVENGQFRYLKPDTQRKGQALVIRHSSSK